MVKQEIDQGLVSEGKYFLDVKIKGSYKVSIHKDATHLWYLLFTIILKESYPKKQSIHLEKKMGKNYIRPGNKHIKHQKV